MDCRRSSEAGPKRTGRHSARTASSATAFRTISGPIPAGSPVVIPTRGLSGLMGARVTRFHCGEERMSRGDTLFFCRFLYTILIPVLTVAVAFGVFGLVHIFYVVFQHEQVGTFSAMQFYAASVIPFDASS